MYVLNSPPSVTKSMDFYCTQLQHYMKFYERRLLISTHASLLYRRTDSIETLSYGKKVTEKLQRNAL